MKSLLFLILFAFITCQALNYNIFTIDPFHPLKRFYDNLKEKGTTQKLYDELAKNGNSAAIKLCIELVPDIPEYLTRYFPTNKEFCNTYIESLNYN